MYIYTPYIQVWPLQRCTVVMFYVHTLYMYTFKCDPLQRCTVSDQNQVIFWVCQKSYVQSHTCICTVLKTNSDIEEVMLYIWQSLWKECQSSVDWHLSGGLSFWTLTWLPSLTPIWLEGGREGGREGDENMRVKDVLTVVWIPISYIHTSCPTGHFPTSQPIIEKRLLLSLC